MGGAAGWGLRRKAGRAPAVPPRPVAHGGGETTGVGRYKREAKAALPRSSDVFDRVVLVHLVLWTAYPVVWLLSPGGVDLVGDAWEAGLFTALDVAAKVGFGFLAASSLRTVGQNGEAGVYETAAPPRPATARA